MKYTSGTAWNFASQVSEYISGAAGVPDPGEPEVVSMANGGEKGGLLIRKNGKVLAK